MEYIESSTGSTLNKCMLLFLLICFAAFHYDLCYGDRAKIKIHLHNDQWSTYALVPLKEVTLCVECVAQPVGPVAYRTTNSCWGRIGTHHIVRRNVKWYSLFGGSFSFSCPMFLFLKSLLTHITFIMAYI